MKYLKFQQDLLKAVEAQDGWKHKDFRYLWFEMDGAVFVCPQDYCIVRIPLKFWYLDTDKVFKTEPWQGESWVKDFHDLAEAVDTHTTLNVVIYGEKKKLRKFTVGSESVFVNENYLKYFDLPDSVFRGTDAKGPIYVFENEVLVGCATPVLYVEEG